jgi:hypothetical protein
LLAILHVAKHPGLVGTPDVIFALRRLNLQVEIVTIRVLARSFDMLHKQSREFLRHTQLLALDVEITNPPRYLQEWALAGFRHITLAYALC